ncbi:DUF6095 family protein [Flavobacterium sp. GT3R68]|uniref:DUF6095 family protein n=1 Tax=Flavobacterium sp. GT3R68 TaxID=2594437 RepID=UPI000F8732A7|nr:DUF6095 family protein [Flavobacterium sp. GT3R68]RTY95220.1 hypothetical protein EKL32_07260 [Flavobacterium sp. GSN2]TRW91038.1 hypothetical protein FNW07_09410 [Flavobacterium sp. GT3R68]
MHTNKEILNKGIKFIAWALPCIFIGPTVIHFALINKLQPIFPLILGFGILICIGAMTLLFLGLKTIMKSLFGH